MACAGPCLSGEQAELRRMDGDGSREKGEGESGERRPATGNEGWPMVAGGGWRSGEGLSEAAEESGDGDRGNRGQRKALRRAGWRRVSHLLCTAEAPTAAAQWPASLQQR